MRRLLLLFILLVACNHPPSHHLAASFTTPLYEVDGLYASMMGPSHTDQDLWLEQEGPPRLVWLTGYDAVAEGPAGEPQPQDLMCHATLSFHRPLADYRALFGAPAFGTPRLFTLSQGQVSVRFPEGFGIPLLSSQRLMLQSQLLNLNPEAINSQVRHRVQAHYLSDDQNQEIKPLCLFTRGIRVPIGDPEAIEAPSQTPTCAPDAGGNPTATEGEQRFTSHWVLADGREVRRTYLGRTFPFDTRAHYISIHVHPFAESLELRDLTTGRTVYKARVVNHPNRPLIEEIEEYSSAKGLPLWRDHDYEMVSVYNKPNQDRHTAMAFMFFYVQDRFFKKPTAEKLALESETFCGTEGPAQKRVTTRP